MELSQKDVVMNRIKHLLLFATVLAVVALFDFQSAKAGEIPNAKKTPPNIVLILVDDLGWMDLGCQGSDLFETPHLDKLAAEGMRFTNGYASCAVCSPTRAAVQTGRYPARLFVTDWIRSRFQGGNIPADKVNPCLLPVEKWNGVKVLCPPNALWMESSELTIAEMLKPAGYTSCYIGKWHLGADEWYPGPTRI